MKKKTTSKTLLSKLQLCTFEQIKLFERMYSPNDIGLDIAVVVQRMPVSKLDHALTQVENTLRLNIPEKHEEYNDNLI